MIPIDDGDVETPETISREAIERCTRSKQPLILPWHPKETIALGTIFRSQDPDNPWSKNSPFDPRSLASTPVVVQRDDGIDASFRKQTTSRSSDTNDHMSLGFAAGGSLPFVAEVSVTGSYDRDVTENKDSHKTSIRSTVRSGYVSFAHQPHLTTDAIITIKYNGGLPAFHARYGDYYVAGYKLGGDVGMLLSGASGARRELEKLSVTVTVEVLMIEESETHTREFVRAEASSRMQLCGYDTLDCEYWREVGDGRGAGAEDVRRRAAEIVRRAQELDERVQDRLDELDVWDGDCLSLEQCRRLTEAGLVVELVLLPVGTLRQVVEWELQDNII